MGHSICDPLNMNMHKYKLCIPRDQISFYIMCYEDAKGMPSSWKDILHFKYGLKQFKQW